MLTATVACLPIMVVLAQAEPLARTVFRQDDQIAGMVGQFCLRLVPGVVPLVRYPSPEDTCRRARADTNHMRRLVTPRICLGGHEQCAGCPRQMYGQDRRCLASAWTRPHSASCVMVPCRSAAPFPGEQRMQNL